MDNERFDASMRIDRIKYASDEEPVLQHFHGILPTELTLRRAKAPCNQLFLVGIDGRQVK
ncbi:hypothetical protein ASD12_25830 [Mesorhizobium sp. Root102]|nr:hypothetical protein ASD12_25830 [Mesorhizobium sp. Root102]